MFATVVIALVIAVLFVLSLVYLRRHGGSCAGCSGCGEGAAGACAHCAGSAGCKGCAPSGHSQKQAR